MGMAISFRRLTADEYTNVMNNLDGVRQEVMIDRELCVSQVFYT